MTTIPGRSGRCPHKDPAVRLAYTRAYAKAHRAEKTAADRLRKYGITQDEFDALLTRQDRRCAICRTDTPEKGTGRGWQVDHDHATGRVRGLLCCKCNRAIGLLNDDSKLLLAAAVYLGGIDA